MTKKFPDQEQRVPVPAREARNAVAKVMEPQALKLRGAPHCVPEALSLTQWMFRVTTGKNVQ